MPNAVRDVHARFFEGTHHIGVLLSTDPRMRQVWKTLENEGRSRESRNPKDLEERLELVAWHLSNENLGRGDG